MTIFTQNLDSIDERIIIEVKQTPGSRLADLARGLCLPLTTVRYRLIELERLGLVRIERGRRLMRIFPVDTQQSAE